MSENREEGKEHSFREQLLLGVGEGEAERVGAVQEVRSGWRDAQEPSQKRFSRKRRRSTIEMEGKKLPFEDM